MSVEPDLGFVPRGAEPKRRRHPERGRADPGIGRVDDPGDDLFGSRHEDPRQFIFTRAPSKASSMSMALVP